MKGKKCVIQLVVFVTAILFSIITCNASFLTIGDWKVEYWRNHPTGTPSDVFDRAVIVIHGTNRNADAYYDYVYNAATTEGLVGHTLIIAPKFKISKDNPDVESELYWENSGWKVGLNALNGSQISSFQVIDHILGKINDNFPNIRFVSIIGHSAGGQFVQRYSAINEKEQGLRSNLKLKYVVANPSSYMYLNADRPLSTVGCSEFDNYKYGMVNLPSVLPYTNLSKAAIQNQLTSRSIYLILGMNDTDPNADDLDKTCPANTQGLHRYERGHYYYDYVMVFNRNSNHKIFDIPDVGHSSNDMFNSEIGREVIFYSQSNPSLIPAILHLILGTK
ncbi:MAG: hypothetical protein D3908_04535 [Candidatus Electrothrix sp. AUS4]|nr:hypothetical protein [Candidatus Electrothrix sp. AUS4]